MQKIGFAEALDSVVANDRSYQRDGYIFLRDALAFTTTQQKKVKGVAVRHVSVSLLLAGVRQYRLRVLRHMANTVFVRLVICACDDI